MRIKINGHNNLLVRPGNPIKNYLDFKYKIANHGSKNFLD